MPDDAETASLMCNLDNNHWVHVELHPDAGTLTGKFIYDDPLPSEAYSGERH
jgi:hypothetical protein